MIIRKLSRGYAILYLAVASSRIHSQVYYLRIPTYIVNFEATPCLIIINAWPELYRLQFNRASTILVLHHRYLPRPFFFAPFLFFLFSLSLSFVLLVSWSFFTGWRTVSSGELWFMASRCLERFVMAVSSKEIVAVQRDKLHNSKVRCILRLVALTNQFVRENRWQIAGFWRLPCSAPTTPTI